MASEHEQEQTQVQL